MTKLTVAVRVRPLSDREIATNAVSIVSVENGKTISVTNIKVPEQNAGDSRERVRRFTFDYCFDAASTQKDIFQNIGKEIGRAIKRRFHSCVLAYGQSSSGKTHTMMGDEDDLGLAPRLCENIFSYLTETAVGSEVENLSASVSYLEIYNEKVRDLLVAEHDGVDGPRRLKVREHPKLGPYVQGLSERSVTDQLQLLDCLNSGNQNRHTAATNVNPRSSRSHAVFTITCQDGVKVRLVDLAGSERAGSRSHTAPVFREGANINRSLVALRNVICALADGSRATKPCRKRFIPYRDSTLTWLLRDTLGGNSKTILISTISPWNGCYSETVNTLRFGQTAKQIVVQPLVNEDPKERTIRELRAEIVKLKELLLLAQVDDLKLGHNAFEQNSCDVTWENAKEFRRELSSDSGLTSSEASEDECASSYVVAEEPRECATEETVVVKFCEVNKVDTLIPVMDVTSAKTKPVAPLRRTFSVDQKMSEEASTSRLLKKPAVVVPEPRKRSIDKSVPSLVTKRRDSIVKAEKGLAAEAKSRVDSLRPGKPRSQIVAAVTHRLYNKVKKKDVATDTDDINLAVEPKELSICSNARIRLQQLTQKALRAHKRRTEETQTDGVFPVLRVKETSTDVIDLKEMCEEVRHADVGTEAVVTSEVGVNCRFLDTLSSKGSHRSLVCTRTCGTSTETLNDDASKPNSISFTKYLQAQPQPRYEVVSKCVPNPIYTSSVNINVNHNYINQKLADNLSDDSLEDVPPSNVCFPDLISNHNSLEPHAMEIPSTTKYLRDLRFSTPNVIHELFFETQPISTDVSTECKASIDYEAHYQDVLDSVRFQTCYAVQIVKQHKSHDFYTYFHCKYPEKCIASISFEKPLHIALITMKPLLLKAATIHEPLHCLETTQDSYHNDSKKVHFEEPTQLYEVMTNFMKEVTTLMTNLSKVAKKLDVTEYDVQVTVNNHNLPKTKTKHKRKRRSETTTQTSPMKTLETATETEETVPLNKYEPIVADSCDRLEKLLDDIETDRNIEESNLHKFPQPFSVTTDWNYVPEDSSLESNPGFSDYGSLPRRNYRRSRLTTCSPSGYLKQLATMRKQIVETSREELLNEARMNV